MMMEDRQYGKKIRAIVCFGPHTDVSGMRAAEYYQVEIDPTMQSPSGEFIRFDQRNQVAQNEIHGWQRIAGMTICEVLEELEDSDESVVFRTVVKE